VIRPGFAGGFVLSVAPYVLARFAGVRNAR